MYILGKIGAKIRHLYYCVLTLFSPKLNTMVRYKNTYNKKIDLDNPKTFNEKGMWLKLNIYNTDKTVFKCADKYRVREYVEDLGCKEILNDLIAVYDSVEEIDWESLPEKFVIKWNFGCGYNLICSDKSKLDIDKAKKILKKWGRKQYYLHFSEMQYKGVEKKLIIEKYLQPENGLQPEDYKFFCFNGQARYVMICLGRDTGNTEFYFFDRDWNLARFNKRGEAAPEGFSLPKPDGIDEMFVYAEKLSKGFPFVRMDFYYVDNKVYFGEMTFTPAGYLDTNYTQYAETTMGNDIVIEK